MVVMNFDSHILIAKRTGDSMSSKTAVQEKDNPVKLR